MRDIKDMDAWLDRIGKQTVSDVAGDLVAEIRTHLHPDNFGYDTGDLKDSFTDLPRGPSRHVTIYALERWKFINFGTKPHIIRPKRPGYPLRWVNESGEHFAWIVHHPGNRAYPFVQLSLEKVKRYRGGGR